MFKKV